MLNASHLEEPQIPANQKRLQSVAWIFAGWVILYLLLLALRISRHFEHLDIVLAGVQYGPILGTLIWYLHSQRENQATLEKLPRLNVLAVVACFALLAFPLSWFAVRGLINPDESGYSFQARIYRSGRIMADPLIGAAANVRDTPAELFYANHVLRPFGWFPKFPPGWPLVLSLGYAISARWLPNAVFGALQLLVIAAIGSRWFSREVGGLAVVLSALSPFYLINSVGMMSHAFCALLAATACLFLCKALSTGKPPYYVIMFACLATTFQVRPYTGFVLTCVMTGAALWFSRSNSKLLIQVLAIGAAFGVLAIVGVLLYNHTYSGRWLVSPYAEAAGADIPPELSLNPAAIVRGMIRYGPFMLLETVLGAFPFLHLLAGYAVFQEKQYRREVGILAALYLGLVLAYLAHPFGYAVFFGERFHFESFFALALLAARGAQLLIERWQIRRRAVSFAFLGLCCIQVAQMASAGEVLSRLGEPYRKVRTAVSSPNVAGLVFLHDSPGFVAKHFNLNDADWRHAPRLYLVDAEPEKRAEWACRNGFSQWFVAGYDPRNHQATLDQGRADCPAVR